MLSFDVVSSLPASLSDRDLLVLARVCTRFFRLRREVSVVLRFVSEFRMQEINSKQRAIHHATDVLSFATASEVQVLTPNSVAVDWGEVIICSAYARREARRRAIDPREEYLRLLIHGILHLRGYDHAREEDESNMFVIQERLLNKILLSS